MPLTVPYKDPVLNKARTFHFQLANHMVRIDGFLTAVAVSAVQESLNSGIRQVGGGIPTPLKNMKVSWDCYSQLNGKITNVSNRQPK